jgi:zinc protease
MRAAWLAAAIAAAAMLGQTAGAAPASKPAAAKTAPKPALKAPAAAGAKTISASAELSKLKLDIPATKYVLKNGLTLIVHEDHKAPIVSFVVWYHVGSKNEPPGRSGFAHLFEHLMFQGSEHFNDDFFKATQKIGATNQNGTTSEDRTNYFQDVPKEALDTILWLESDRMGHLLGAVNQARLDEQRGVVQNEKRQDENQPYGQAFNLITKATYPPEHPYGHTVIGSMEDLDAATLDQVKDWFRTYYGPSNAVVVLAGDITPAEARAKVEKYFGDIPPGPPVTHPKVWIAKRTGAQRETAYDRVAQPRLYKVWNTPEYGARDADLLQIFADVLSGDVASRLDKRLVHDEQIATSVSVFPQPNEIGGQFLVMVNGKPGADMGRIEREVDEEMARLIASGPTAAELAKARARSIADFTRSLEAANRKAQILAQNETYLGDFNGWKRSLEVTRTATAKEIQDAGRRWLTDGSYSLTVLPFPDFAAAPTGADRSKVPEPGPVAPARFPQVERSTLSNGLKVLLVQRHELPVVNMQLLVDTGYADDYAQLTPGVGQLVAALMTEGTTHRTGLQITNELETLGASLSVGGGGETAVANFSALKPTLDPALDIFADVILNPAFRPEDFKRVQAQQVAAIQRSKRDPNGIAGRVLRVAVFGPDHPYGRLATEAGVGALTREDVARYHERWYTPNNATLIVVGDVTMPELKARLDKALAAWKPGTSRRIVPPPPPRATKPVIYLVDRPGSLQSVIDAAVPAPPRNAQDEIRIGMFNNLLGGDFTSRVNMNLREDKHWSYGASSGLTGDRGPRILLVQAPVQTDKTKESVQEIAKELKDILGDRKITAQELAASKSDQVLGLSGQWETARGVEGSLANVVLYHLPDDYYATYGGRVQALTVQEVNAEGPQLIPPGTNLVWVVVGDRAKIEAGLRSLNIGEVRVVDADGKPVAR